MLTTNVVIPSYVPKKGFKGESPYIVLMDITPEIAKYWLDTYNQSNRTLTRKHVLFLAEQMTKGEWVEMNGNTISFLPDGQLNDGQHRLAAIVKANITLKFLVVVGVSVDSFKVMDTGKNRSGSDVLSIEGYNNTALTSAIVSFILKFKSGHYGTNGKGYGASMITNTSILDFVKTNEKKLLKCRDFIQKAYHAGDKLVPTSILGGMLFILSEKDEKQAESFIFKLATGSDLAINSALFMLRFKLRSYKDSDTKRITSKARLALIVKTWNSIRSGSKPKLLRYNPSRGEKFPKII